MEFLQLQSESVRLSRRHLPTFHGTSWTAWSSPQFRLNKVSNLPSPAASYLFFVSTTTHNTLSQNPPTIDYSKTMASFYDTTIPQLRKINLAAINVLTAAQTEISNGLPITDAEVLDASLGDMLPFRMQPILLAKFETAPMTKLNLSSATVPNLDPASFTSFGSIIDFFTALNAVLDSVSQEAWNSAADDAFELVIGGKTLKITQLQDYTEGFMVPHCWFHLNAMYMLLRSKGFSLGKAVFVAAWASETLKKDFAPLKG